MRYNELHKITQKQEPKPDTYEAGMAMNQLLKIGTHAIKIHNMIDDRAEMEAWVAKKIDLASNYVKSVHGYTAGSKAGTYDDDGMTEDAGEGHMSKSQLYQTAKMSIELLDMINKGDDLEGWVQTKLNLAADYLQAVYHYEDYQKLNPYREELDSALVQRHAGVIQKHLDEILSKETETADVDTKPGMMRILKKRVNEVEKEIAKENRKNTDEGDGRKAGIHPKGHPMRHKQQAAIHANEANLEEGIKDWAKSLAMAGIFVAGLAGVGSINDAINNSVPAIKAMNNALEIAKDQNNNELVAQIEKDIKGAKLRLDIGKDLNQVKYLQDKYSEFMPTEGLAYESKLAIMLNQHIK